MPWWIYSLLIFIYSDFNMIKKSFKSKLINFAPFLAPDIALLSSNFFSINDAIGARASSSNSSLSPLSTNLILWCSVLRGLQSHTKFTYVTLLVVGTSIFLWSQFYLSLSYHICFPGKFYPIHCSCCVPIFCNPHYTIVSLYCLLYHWYHIHALHVVCWILAALNDDGLNCFFCFSVSSCI